MKPKQIIVLLSFILFFGACKKKYSCSCQAAVQVYTEVPNGPGSYSYTYFNTLQSINEKVTKKQAKDVCDKTAKALESSLKKRFSWTGVSVSGSCDVK